MFNVHGWTADVLTFFFCHFDRFWTDSMTIFERFWTGVMTIFWQVALGGRVTSVSLGVDHSMAVVKSWMSK